MGPETDQNLLINKRLTIDDWRARFPQIPPNQIAQIISHYDNAKIQGLIDSCIQGDLMAVMAGTYKLTKIETSQE